MPDRWSCLRRQLRQASQPDPDHDTAAVGLADLRRELDEGFLNVAGRVAAGPVRALRVAYEVHPVSAVPVSPQVVNACSQPLAPLEALRLEVSRIVRSHQGH